MEFVVTKVNRYDFKDQTGKQVSGVKVQYLTDVEPSVNAKGLDTLNITAPFELYSNFKQVPGVYRLDMRQKPGPGGRPTLALVNATFVREVKIV